MSIDQTVLLNYRLAPDMLRFSRQVQLVGDFAKNTVARLTGVEGPKYDDSETTLAQLKDRLVKTMALVESASPSAFDGADEPDITIPIAGQPTTFKGRDCLRHFALPNFYFHAATAYAILRHCGVAIGKRDFLGRA